MMLFLVDKMPFSVINTFMKLTCFIMTVFLWDALDIGCGWQPNLLLKSMGTSLLQPRWTGATDEYLYNNNRIKIKVSKLMSISHFQSYLCLLALNWLVVGISVFYSSLYEWCFHIDQIPGKYMKLSKLTEICIRKKTNCWQDTFITGS